ncbi:MAG: site-2 protease family protein [Sporichthyaceae bacterium]|nr:site-2 protease family protein [Sporichthyaceae bacterium]
MGRPFGVPVDVTPTWFIVAGLITYGFAGTVERAVPDIGSWKYAVSLTFALLLYSSVLVHELSHTLVALRAGLPVRRISLHLLGGVSEIERPAETPGREAGIALAGPLVSLALAAAGFAFSSLLEGGTVGLLLTRALVISNLLVGMFNLLPGLPLDGGRVLSAAVWRVTGRRHTGTIVAAWVGRGVAVVVLLLPFLLAAGDPGSLDVVDVVWGALLGAFIWVGASQSLQHASVQRRLPGVTVRALTRRAIPVDVALPLSEALRQAAEVGAHGMVVVSAGGEPVGLVVEAAVRAVPSERRPWVPVGDLSRRLEAGHRLPADLQGEELITTMTREPASEYLVVEANGEIYGVLATADVERALTRA